MKRIFGTKKEKVSRPAPMAFPEEAHDNYHNIREQEKDVGFKASSQSHMGFAGTTTYHRGRQLKVDHQG